MEFFVLEKEKSWMMLNAAVAKRLERGRFGFRGFNRDGLVDIASADAVKMRILDSILFMSRGKNLFEDSRVFMSTHKWALVIARLHNT